MHKVTLPWSKSLTNRDLILASISDWLCVLKWYLVSDDTTRMIKALRDLMIEIIESDWDLIVKWWVDKIEWNDKNIYVNQSWTCIRFLTWLALLNKSWTITLSWEERLMKRPMKDLIDSIRQMWIRVDSNWDYPPLTIHPWNIVNNKISMRWDTSSQFFTALFQVAPLMKGWLEIEVVWEMVSRPYIDLSINELRKFAIQIINNDYKHFIIPEQKIKNPWILTIEWDASALSYIANYSLLFWKKINVTNIWKDSKQWDYKYLEILKRYFWFDFDADSSTSLLWTRIQQDIWTYREVDFESMPDVSMSFMSIAPLLPWKTKIIWLQTLNLKECDRINAMWEELKKLWVDLVYDDSSITINEWFNVPKEVEIDTYNDHRIAMVFWILRKYLEKNYDTKIKILNPECVAKTYPNFWEELKCLEQHLNDINK